MPRDSVFTDNGNSIIRQVAGATAPAASREHTVAAPADALSASTASPMEVEYVLTVIGEGNQAQQPMAAKLDLLQRSFQALEH